MKQVYGLMMIDEDSSYDDHIEAFNIGFFSSYEKAEKTARKYLAEVEGFKDYNVTYQITEKSLIACTGSLSEDIFIIYGWNENDELDEVDVIESDCYINKNEAEQRLNELKTSYYRKEWCIDKYMLNECKWKEGFVKVHF